MKQSNCILKWSESLLIYMCCNAIYSANNYRTGDCICQTGDAYLKQTVCQMSEQKSHLKTFNTRQLKKVHYYNFETVASRQVSWMDQDNLAISNHLVSILTFEHVSVHWWLIILLVFRIKWDFNFDDAIAETYGCEVHSFDPRYVQSQILLSLCWCLHGYS